MMPRIRPLVTQKYTNVNLFGNSNLEIKTATASVLDSITATGLSFQQLVPQLVNEAHVRLNSTLKNVNDTLTRNRLPSETSESKIKNSLTDIKIKGNKQEVTM